MDAVVSLIIMHTRRRRQTPAALRRWDGFYLGIAFGAKRNHIATPGSSAGCTESPAYAVDLSGLPHSRVSPHCVVGLDRNWHVASTRSPGGRDGSTLSYLLLRVEPIVVGLPQRPARGGRASQRASRLAVMESAEAQILALAETRSMPALEGDRRAAATEAHFCQGLSEPSKGGLHQAGTRARRCPTFLGVWGVK
jgi:hypothetical protein